MKLLTIWNKDFLSNQPELHSHCLSDSDVFINLHRLILYRLIKFNLFEQLYQGRNWRDIFKENYLFKQLIWIVWMQIQFSWSFKLVSQQSSFQVGSAKLKSTDNFNWDNLICRKILANSKGIYFQKIKFIKSVCNRAAVIKWINIILNLISIRHYKDVFTHKYGTSF